MSFYQDRDALERAVLERVGNKLTGNLQQRVPIRLTKKGALPQIEPQATSNPLGYYGTTGLKNIEGALRNVQGIPKGIAAAPTSPVPAYANMTPEQQAEQNFVGSMINQQRSAMMSNVPTQTIPAIEQGAFQRRLRKLDDSQREQQQYNRSLIGPEQARSDEAFKMQRDRENMYMQALRMLNSSWAGENDKIAAIQTIQAIKGAQKPDDYAGRAERNVTALSNSALNMAKERESELAAALGTVDLGTRGQANVAAIDESRARTGLSKQQTALLPITARIKALAAANKQKDNSDLKIIPEILPEAYTDPAKRQQVAQAILDRILNR